MDIASCELSRQGVRLKVQEQPFRVLCYLVEHAGEIVAREELQRHLWADGTFVDFEHSLNTAIKKLRQALDDTPENPRFIETVPRRGYKFIAPVQWIGPSRAVPNEATGPRGDVDTADSEVSVPSSNPTAIPLPTIGSSGEERSTSFPETTRDASSDAGTRASSDYRAIAIFVVAAVVALGAFAIWRWTRSSNPAPPADAYKVVPLTSFPGVETYGALSPDGDKIAFSWDRDKGADLHVFVKQIGAEEPLQLTTGNASEHAPTWSPDGKYIAFIRAPNQFVDDPTGDVVIMSALGGSERKVATLHLQGKIGTITTPALSWSPDGKTIAVANRTPDAKTFAIYLLSLDSLEMRQLTFPTDFQEGDGMPAFSPDGKTIAFVRSGKEASDIYSVPVAGGTARQLTNEKHFLLLGVAWTADGESIVYTGSGLRMISAKGGKSRMLMPSTMAASISIVGKRMVYSEFSFKENLYSAGLEANKVVGQWQKRFASTHVEEGLRFSPDGKRVAFQSTRSGSMEIWVSESDGSNPIRLTNYGWPLTGSPRWSPDGQTIVYDSRPNGNADLFAISPNGGQPRQLTKDSTDEVMPSYSSDGQWIYFASNRGGSWNVWKMPAAGGDAVQLTRGEGFTAVESPDGKYVYYAHGPARPGLMRIPVEGGTEEEVLPDLGPLLYGYWTATPSGIYYAKQQAVTTPSNTSLHFYSFATKTSIKVADLPYQLFNGAPGLEVSPDGRTILMVMTQDQGADLRLVENFQ